jgi:agmatinase
MRFSSGADSRFDVRVGRRLLDIPVGSSDLVDVGDAEVAAADPSTTATNIIASVRAIVAAGAVPVVLGGDHSITHPVVQAFDGPLHVVQFDAHLDYARARDTDRYSNAHAFRQISTMDSVSALIQVGIRSLRTEVGLYEDSLADGNRIVSPAELRELEAEGVAQLVPERARCFVSIDVDALDMPLVPGCVSAEPGGLSYAELRNTLVAIADRVQIVGIDLVEVNPMVDTAAGATAYLAAHLLIEALDAIAQG